MPSSQRSASTTRSAIACGARRAASSALDRRHGAAMAGAGNFKWRKHCWPFTRCLWLGDPKPGPAPAGSGGRDVIDNCLEKPNSRLGCELLPAVLHCYLRGATGGCVNFARIGRSEFLATLERLGDGDAVSFALAALMKVPKEHSHMTQLSW